MDALFETNLSEFPLLHRGKVRDIYKVEDQHLLIVTTDRISAFDVVLPTPIPGKGRVLTKLSNFWFRQTSPIILNHNISIRSLDLPKEIIGRSMLVRKVKPLPIEAIVRGYLVGSAWKDYQQTGQVCGVDLRPGLRLGDQLSRPIFTPSTKAAIGSHDENISQHELIDLIGLNLAEEIRFLSVELYQLAFAHAIKQGIIIADTKFEFGLDDEGELILIDELFTPDSSRFWPVDEYKPGTNPPSFDKQFVRDYLETLDWDKKDPGPVLPPDIVTKTAEKYEEVLKRLTLNK